MIAATHNIILFNKRLDSETRRDVFIATFISGVSVYNNKHSTSDDNFHRATENFKIRIPITANIQNNKTYIPETRYDDLNFSEAMEYWTLHTEDLIIVYGSENIDFSLLESALSQQQIEEIANNYGLQKEVISVVDYSDNTLRGSKRTKHWRIGGA